VLHYNRIFYKKFKD